MIARSTAGHATKVAQLLERKADIHTQDTSGMNAIHHAAAGNSTSIIHILLRSAQSSDAVNAVDGKGFGL